MKKLFLIAAALAATTPTIAGELSPYWGTMDGYAKMADIRNYVVGHRSSLLCPAEPDWSEERKAEYVQENVKTREDAMRQIFIRCVQKGTLEASRRSD
jgi:hypothetical protein